MMNIKTAWARLLSVQELHFEAHSRAVPNTGWNGTGKGVVQVEKIEPSIIVFQERGTWTPHQGQQTTFTNVFRWTASFDSHALHLEHLRFGTDHPVHLFDLVAVEGGVLVSSEPHVCREDLYAGRMDFREQAVQLRWTINGPQKAETITYTYKSS